MMSANLQRSLTASWCSDRRHLSGAASTCVPIGYTGTPALCLIEEHGYIPHVKWRGQEADEKRQYPTKRARMWIVEVAHSWFNRFRKLLVRHEKLERSFLGLNHLAAAIIAFRKIKLTINIIYL
jgi:transposase